MNLFIAISGCSGGNRGPQGIYQQFKKNDIFDILPVNTIPDDIENNVLQITSIALEKLKSYKNIFLIGYSMGGAIAVKAAKQLNDSGSKISGLALLSTQTDGLHDLKSLNVPVLFCHGSEDLYFPIWQITSIFNGYNGPKKMVVIDEVDHDFTLSQEKMHSNYSSELCKMVFMEITEFFLAKAERSSIGEVVNKKIPNVTNALKKNKFSDCSIL